jgi:ABC-type lipoprotein release transport system permease subunit
VSDLRDERGQLLDVEAQGARPAALRRVVRLRSAVVACAGLVGGIVAGAVLSRLVVDLVAVTANARAVELPLELALDWRVLALAVGACGLLASVLVVAATRRA